MILLQSGLQLTTPLGPGTPQIDRSVLLNSATQAADSASLLSELAPFAYGAAALLLFAAGVAAGAGIKGVIDRYNMANNKPRWPRDWPKYKDLFTTDPDPSKPGYMALTPRQAMGSGAMPLGRTYPRYSIFPDKYPFREWRRRVQFWTSHPVWVPYMKRFQHFGVLGATGKGKSTSFAIPILAYGALEKNTAYFAIDVKSPAFVRMFANLYKEAGKDVIFFDPWSIDETLAFEPLWRASEERKDIIAEVIATYTADTGVQQTSENSEFFRVAAIRLLRGVIDLAQYFPRRYCNLPCVQQLIGSGGNVLKEAFQKADELMPDLDELLAAIEQVLPATPEQLRARPRNEILEGALAVLDRSGYRIAFMVRRMRRYEAEHRNGSRTAQEMEEIRSVFWAQIKHEWLERRKKLDSIIMNQGEFINAPEDTRNSIVSTITNKTNWFKDPNIARAFSRDEIDIRTLVDTSCLFLVGAHMSKLKVGSLFVAALLSNLAINAVFQRGMALERKDKRTGRHGIFFLLDEFPQLNIKSAPNILATFRGFLAGLVMVYQERGQVRQLYGEDATTMEGNTVHKVLLAGAHEDTAEFYAQKSIGTATIVKRSKSGSPGEKQSISESVEDVPLMSTIDVRNMQLNGKPKPGMALSVGTDVPAFPLLPIPYYNDPTLRQLLKLRHRLIKKGPDGRPTWKFWHWQERWEQTEESPPYLNRRRQLSPSERAKGAHDPVYERMCDPYTQYLDYLLNDYKGFDELVEPRLVLADIAVTENDPRSTAVARSGHEAMTAGGGRGEPALPAALLVPIYGADFRQLINDDFRGIEFITPASYTGSLEDRVEVYMNEEDE